MSCLIASLKNFFRLPLSLLKPTIGNLSHLLARHLHISFSHAWTISISLPFSFPFHLVPNIFIPNIISPNIPHIHLCILIFATLIFRIWKLLTGQHCISYNIVGHLATPPSAKVHNIDDMFDLLQPNNTNSNTHWANSKAHVHERIQPSKQKISQIPEYLSNPFQTPFLEADVMPMIQVHRGTLAQNLYIF